MNLVNRISAITSATTVMNESGIFSQRTTRMMVLLCHLTLVSCWSAVTMAQDIQNIPVERIKLDDFSGFPYLDTVLWGPQSLKFGDGVQQIRRKVQVTGLGALLYIVLCIVVAVYVRRTLRYFINGMHFSNEIISPLKTAARASIGLWLFVLLMDHAPAFFVNFAYSINGTVETEFQLHGIVLAMCLGLNVLAYLLEMASRDADELRKIV